MQRVERPGERLCRERRLGSGARRAVGRRSCPRARAAAAGGVSFLPPQSKRPRSQRRHPAQSSALTRISTLAEEQEGQVSAWPWQGAQTHGWRCAGAVLLARDDRARPRPANHDRPSSCPPPLPSLPQCSRSCARCPRRRRRPSRAPSRRHPPCSLTRRAPVRPRTTAARSDGAWVSRSSPVRPALLLPCSARLARGTVR